MANYLREPYSADLDFGTGEWSIGSWVNISSTVAYQTAPLGAELSTGSFTADTINYALLSSNTKKGLYRISIDYGSGTNNVMSGYFGSMGPDNNRFDTRDGVGNVLKAVYYSGSVTTVYIYHDGAYPGNKFYCYQGALTATVSVKELAATSVLTRSHSSGPYFNIYTTALGNIQATASDGTTTRTVTTDAAYNTGTWLKAEATYKSGKLAILVNGIEVKSTVGAPLLSLNSRYNLLTYTEQFDNAAWSNAGNRLSISANDATAPNGTQTADKLSVIAGASDPNNAGLYQNPAITGKTVTLTAYYKYGNSQWTCLSLSGGASPQRVFFDILNGVKGAEQNGATGTITNAGNDWYLCSVTATATGDFVCCNAATDANASSAVTLGKYSYVWGAQLETGSTAKTYQRVGAATDFDFQAPLTIGNSYDLTAPFPGSLALVKLSATVPTAEQAQWMYEQEKMMFQPNAQITLPDSNAIQDLAYDDLTDRWIAVSTTNKSTWSGLVRTSNEVVPAGTYSRVSASSGVQLSARITTNAGVDITIPAYNVKSKNKKKAEKSKKLSNSTAIFEFTPVVFTNATLNGTSTMTCSTVSGTPYVGMGVTGTGIPNGTTIIGINGTSYYLSANATAGTVTVSQNTFNLPVGYTAKFVYSAGALQRESATKAYTRTFDGFRETIVFGVSPGISVVQIHANKV